MEFPCETIVRDILPSFKAFIVKELYQKYNFTQSKIANVLQITQASVSYYLHGERGKDVLDLIEKNDTIKEKLITLTKAIATESEMPGSFIKDICGLCTSVHSILGCRATERGKEKKE